MFRFVFVAIALSIFAGTQSWAIEDGEPDSFDLLGYFPTSEASRRIRPFHLRLSLLYGPVNYTSTNAASDAIVEAKTYQQGVRLELEHWFRIGNMNRRPFGLALDFQNLFVNRFSVIEGGLIRYTSTSALLGLRLLGYGHAQPWRPEITLFAGPAFETFPTMQLNFGLTRYNLVVPTSLGLRGGLRLRFPLLPRFQMLSLEAAGYYTYPYKLMGDIEGQTHKAGTRSYGANLLMDLRIYQTMVLGFGGYFGWYRLQYDAGTLSVPDQVRFFTQSFVTSVRFGF